MTLKEEMDKEKRHIEKWQLKVDLATKKLTHLLRMYDERNK